MGEHNREAPAVWEPWGSYAMRTATHSIARCSVKGVAIYVLWQLPDRIQGRYRSFTAAKAAATGMFNHGLFNEEKTRYGLLQTTAGEKNQIRRTQGRDREAIGG